MKLSDVILKGKHVILRPMTADDVDGLYEAGKSERIWTYMFMNIKTKEEMERLVSDALMNKAAGTEFPFVIIDQQSGKIVGSTRFLNIHIAHRRLEIGWTWLHPAVWRTKINTECKWLLLNHCFETLQMMRVAFRTHHENIQSQRAIERLGAKKEGVFRNHMIMPNNTIRHTVCYSIVLDEWAEVKENLLARLEG